MIKAAIFDIDNTLYSYDDAHRAAWQALAAFAAEALSVTPELLETLHADAFRLQRQRGGNCAALHNRLIRYQLMLEALGKPIGLAPVMADLYWTALLGRMAPFPDAGEALAKLRAMGVKIGIGTNMTADYQFAKLERMNLMDQVDFLVTSEEAGAEKPDGRLFALCAEKAGCPASECAFIGDSLKGDALGARDAGMRAVWLRPGPDPAEVPPGVVRVRALAELPELLPTL